MTTLGSRVYGLVSSRALSPLRMALCEAAGVIRSVALPRSYYLASPAHGPIDFRTRLLLNRPNWYHDFSMLGLRTHVFPGHSYALSQATKAPALLGLIAKAIEHTRASGFELKGVDFFCADAFYANWALAFGADHMDVIDLGGSSVEGAVRSPVLRQAAVASKLLGNADYLNVIEGDVRTVQGTWDFAIAAGGLYHLEEPLHFLADLHTKVRSSLVLQTVTSLERQDCDYFESPAPNQTWGSRFSADFLLKSLPGLGWKVLQSSRSVLEYNSRLSDRGSISILCSRL